MSFTRSQVSAQCAPLYRRSCYEWIFVSIDTEIDIGRRNSIIIFSHFHLFKCMPERIGRIFHLLLCNRFVERNVLVQFTAHYRAPPFPPRAPLPPPENGCEMVEGTRCSLAAFDSERIYSMFLRIDFHYHLEIHTDRAHNERSDPISSTPPLCRQIIISFLFLFQLVFKRKKMKWNVHNWN